MSNFSDSTGSQRHSGWHQNVRGQSRDWSTDTEKKNGVKPRASLNCERPIPGAYMAYYSYWHQSLRTGKHWSHFALLNTLRRNRCSQLSLEYLQKTSHPKTSIKMPKISKRRTALDEPSYGSQTSTMNETRIVSFEETPIPLSPRLNSLHSTSSGSLPRTSCCRDFSQASQLRSRLTSSFCLTEMEDGHEVSDDQEVHQCFGSPVSMEDNEESCSLWGQFIDVVSPSPEKELSKSCHAASPLLSGFSSINSFRPYHKPNRGSIGNTKEFLPDFILGIPRTITTPTDEVVGALRQMQM